MTKHTIYARPTFIKQSDDWKKDKKYSSWANTSYMGVTKKSTVEENNKFSGAWITTSGSGNLGESYNPKNIKYSKIYLNSKKYNKKKPPSITASNFYIQLPRNASITKVGIIISCYSDRGMNLEAPTVKPKGINLPSKNLHSIYAKEKDHYVTNDTKYTVDQRLFVSKNIPYSRRNLTYQWSGNDLKGIDVDNLERIVAGFEVDFKENKSNVGGFLYVDAIAVYVEYETPEYTVTNGYNQVKAVAGEEFAHTVRLHNVNGYKADKNYTKIKIPSCFEVDEDKTTCTKGSFTRYDGTDYEKLYSAQIIPLNGNCEWLKKPEKGKNSVVVQGTDLVIRLVDGYGHAIPYQQVTFLIDGQIYLRKTDYEGHAWMRINLTRTGTYTVECSFVSSIYDDAYSKFKMDVISDKKVRIELLDTANSESNFYQGSYFTARAYVGTNEIVPTGKMNFTFTNKANSKDVVKFTENIDGGGSASHLINFGAGKTYDVKVEYVPKSYSTDSKGKPIYQFNKSSTTTVLKVLQEVKQDANISVVGSKTGYNKYNANTNSYEYVDDNVYHVGVLHHLIFEFKDSNNKHVLDKEPVDIQVITKYNEKTGNWEYIDDRYSLYKTTSYYGRASYDFNIPKGKYQLEVILMPNKASHWNKAVLQITVEVHDPPLDKDFNYIWICDKPDDEYLNIMLKPVTTGICKIEAWNSTNGFLPTCTYDISEYPDGDGIFFLTNEIHRNTDETIDLIFQFNPKDYEPDFTDTFKITCNCKYPRKVGSTTNEYEMFNDIDWDSVKWEDVDEATLNKGYLAGEGVDGTYFINIIPKDNSPYIAYVKLPIHTYAPAGFECQFCIQIEDNSYKHCHTLKILDKLPYKMDINSVESKFTRKTQQLSRATWQGYTLDCGGANSTRFNYQQTFKSVVESPFIFIGPVKLSRSHSKPTGSTTQTLLSRQYKNRVILKKKGDYEDKVETTIRMTPQQLATVKGLCKLDMPTPIHLANVPAWNPLTVHGWVELYQTSNEKEINSKLYEAKLEWRYLTKELYSLMTIIRDKDPVHKYTVNNNFGTVHYPSDPIFDFFDYTGQGMIIDDDDKDYSEIYVEAGESETLTSTKPVPVNSRITVDWRDYLTSKSNEELSSMNRSFSILTKDKDNGQFKTIFRYDYSDFTHFLYDNEYPVDTIINNVSAKATLYENDVPRILNSSNVILDFNEDYVTENANSTEYTDSEGYPNYTVGSRLIFTFNGNRLTIQDCGASGNEFFLEDIELDDGEYYIRMELQNQSNEDNSSYFGAGWQSLVSVQEEADLNNPAYDNVYAEHIVSPAPIFNAPLSFTRYGEDGLIYYYRYKDNITYKYRGDPYNPYKNGTDFSTIDGVSLFDCNNDLSPLCLSNGLVKVAIHRYAGYVEFFRWSVDRESYVACGSMWADMDNRHIQVDKISDDYIQLTWGSTQWRIWRGRPFVEVQHDNVDFRFNDTIEKVYAETGTGVMGTYDIQGNLNLLDYLGKNTGLDESLVSVGISNLPNDDLTINYVSVESVEVENETETVKSTADLKAESISVPVGFEEVLKIKGKAVNSKNKVQSGVVCHLYSYDYDYDCWNDTGLKDITGSDGTFLFTHENLKEDNGLTMKYKVVYLGTDDFKATESKEITVTYGVGKEEPNMKVFITPKNSSRIDAEGNNHYYVGDKVDITAVLVDSSNNPITGNVTFYYDTEDSGLPTNTVETNDKGVAVWSNAVLPKEGYRYVHASYKGNDKYSADNASIQCTIRDTVTITVKQDPPFAMYSNIVSFTVSLRNSSGDLLEGEQVSYNIPSIGKYGYGNTLPDGTYEFECDDISGDDSTKQIMINYLGSSIYDPCSLSYLFTINKEGIIVTLDITPNTMELSDGVAQVTATGYCKNIYNDGVSGVSVRLCDDNSDNLVGTTTNSDGYYTMNYTYNRAGTYHLYVMVFDDDRNGNSVSKIVNIEPESTELNTSIILTANNVYKVIGESECVLTVTVLDENNLTIPNAKVSLKENDKVINTGVTGSDGTIKFTYTNEEVGSHNIKAYYDGEPDVYKSSYTSDGLDITVQDSKGSIITTLTMDSSSGTTEVFNGVPLPITALLRDKDGNSIPNQTIYLIEDDEVIDFDVTNASGLCTFYYMGSYAGTHKVYLDYVSNGSFKSSKSDTIDYTFNS